MTDSARQGRAMGLLAGFRPLPHELSLVGTPSPSKPGDDGRAVRVRVGAAVLSGSVHLGRRGWALIGDKELP